MSKINIEYAVQIWQEGNQYVAYAECLYSKSEENIVPIGATT